MPRADVENRYYRCMEIIARGSSTGALFTDESYYIGVV